MVVLRSVVLKRRPDGGHVGFWTEFEGEKVSSYEDTRGDNNIVYTLYRCTAYQGVTLTASTSRTKATPGRRSTCYTPLGGIRALGVDARTSRRCGTERT
jgi:hypothetical protein